MPSPPIRSSTPGPKTNCPRSSFSDGSKKFLWPKKVENYLTGKNNSKKNSELTEEKLEEFNQINEILYEHRRSSFNSTRVSPYYKGLTDSSLHLNRQKLSELSPGRESDASSIASSTISSFIGKMHELSSCFSSPSVEEKAVQVKSEVSSGRRRSKCSQTSSSSLTKTRFTTLAKEMGMEREVISIHSTRNTDCLLVKKKPLRERVSNTPSPPPLGNLQPPPLSPRPRATPPILVAVNPSSPTTNQSPPPSEPQVLPPTSLPQEKLLQCAPPSLLSASLPLATQPTPPQPPPTPAQLEQQAPSPPPSPAQLEQQAPSPPPTSPQIQQQAPSPTPPSQTSTQNLLGPPRAQPQRTLANTTKDESTCKTKNEKVYVWADRYRPAVLNDFICNRDKALELQSKAKPENCGHFIFEGPTGVGKRTMIWAMLREAFGPDRVQTRDEIKKFVLQGEAVGSIKVTVKISLQHIEVSLSEVQGYEKHVIVELIQETITRLSKKALQCNKDNCRVIILYEADKLSDDALLYIKWQLERHSGCNVVFFCCTSASKLQPIMSLCTVVKLLPPSNEEIIEVLEFIAKQEGIELPNQLGVRIANNSKNNLRQAIRSFEATWNANSTLKEDQVLLTGWEDDIANIATNIVEEQSPQQLYNVRGKLQNLIEHNVCPEFIFDALVEELKQCSVEEFHPQIDSLYKKYKNLAPSRHSVKKNLHQFMIIEEFIAKFMSCYKISIMNKGK